MIQELSVQDFAIISSLTIQFKGGMTVLTGETGAGKSIIIDAMGLLVGGRGSSDFIRDGTERCRIEGAFYVENQLPIKAYLTEIGVDMPDELLILQREIFRTGRNICRINGQLVNTKILREVGHRLVDIHGQNEHQELMDATQHLGLLDDFDKSMLQPLLANYQDLYQQYMHVSQQIDSYQTHEKEFAQRMDMLQFQFDEIGTANLEVDEDTRLLEERSKLMNYQKIVQTLSSSYDALEGEGAQTLDLVGRVMTNLEQIESLDTDYAETTELVRNAYYLLQEAAGRLSSHLDVLEMDDGRLDEVETRLDTIRQLKRKYGEQITDILAYFDSIKQELELTTTDTIQLDELFQLKEHLFGELTVAADKLTNERKKVAQRLEKAILEQLKGLYMENTQFKVHFQLTTPKFTRLGQDKIEFYISTNIGEALKPLAKVASGGELSRLMLALKTIFSQTQAITSIIFDEVDTGVSGRVAQSIAEKIHQIGENSQVLCITHLPQVAAEADTQYFIEKRVVDDRTETHVRELNNDGRVKEIARMLAGSEVTSLTLQHAKELLKLAHD
ncbi:DNA repair protein RecN [Vagococcus penaei]|uniref:DNA repair protein RecN n=1 Tax=Vagococcus penaei TaxID=633807 RepID=A0A1Q2D7T9_9ENTE|nr:DNA repair protein RecN [Vagococcus penaei]AQP54412.1 DNA repair protein RecN [Vagococcus penaei]RSU06329.1 DNA repair protein RecN [Vagococcus penaei]